MVQNPYFQNVVSEFIAIAIIVLISWTAYTFIRRRILLRFFHCAETKRIVLYLSNLKIQTGGAIGVDGQPRSFGEAAVPLCEVNIIPWFQRLFNFLVPGLSSQPGIFRWLLISDVTVAVLPSPRIETEVDRSTTMITVGSPGYNLVSGRVEKVFHTLATFTNDNQAICLAGTPPISTDGCAFVQRVTDPTSGQVAFYVAGPSSRGTSAAAHYLAQNWRSLAKRYNNGRPFCVVLRAAGNDPASIEVLYERGGEI